MPRALRLVRAWLVWTDPKKWHGLMRPVVVVVVGGFVGHIVAGTVVLLIAVSCGGGIVVVDAAAATVMASVAVVAVVVATAASFSGVVCGGAGGEVREDGGGGGRDHVGGVACVALAVDTLLSPLPLIRRAPFHARRRQCALTRRPNASAVAREESGDVALPHLGGRGGWEGGEGEGGERAEARKCRRFLPFRKCVTSSKQSTEG